jgi:hypothetical protein
MLQLANGIAAGSSGVPAPCASKAALLNAKN